MPLKPVVDHTPEVKVLSEPAGTVNASHISIKKILEDQAKNPTTINHENLPREAFTKDSVKMFWKRFAFKVKENGMETFYNALIKREPVFLEDERLAIEVDNKVQEDYINPMLNEFINYLRQELKNYGISVEIILTEDPMKEVKFLTGKDKFNALARKNKNLHTLKSLFNLDIEY